VSVLVDSSVWIAYFRGSEKEEVLDSLIEQNLVVINDLILTELVPSLHVRRQQRLINLLKEIEKKPVKIDWEDLIRMQIICINNGINNIGVADLIIAQHAIQNNLSLYTLDKHFTLLSRHIPLSIY